MELVAGRIFWVDACWPHGAVVNMNVCGASVRCRVSGKTPPAVTFGALVLGVVGGLWFFFLLRSSLPAGLVVWLVVVVGVV